MQLIYRPYTLELRHQFTVSGSSRSTTPVVLIELHSDGLIGYGESSLPPYLCETQSSVMQFLASLSLAPFSTATPMEEVLHYVMGAAPHNTAAKAAVDMALHDLYGKANNSPLWKLWQLNRENIPPTSFTIGIDTPEQMRAKTLEAVGFKILKVKLGTEQDKAMVEAIRSVSQAPLCIDANQGWRDKYHALDMLQWCSEQGVLFAEQPMPKEQLRDTAWLTARSPIPIMADESFQRLTDLPRVADAFSGVNIKLMKCTGLHEARQIIAEARKQQLKVMLGCMTETSCAISAAAQLSPLADWVDLDGNLLITNDPYRGAQLTEGRMMPAEHLPGIGMELR